jgi:hypothetical protein
VSGVEQDHGLLQPSRPQFWSPSDLPEGTTGLRLVRPVQPGDRLRAYTAMDCKDGAAGITQTLNQLFIHGDVIDTEGSYGLIDLLGESDTILGEIGIADPAAFQRLRRKLGCRIESTDGDPLATPQTTKDGEG